MGVEREADALRRRAGDSLTVFFICQTGTRSQLAADRLRSAGFTHVIHVDGGTNAWAAEGLPLVQGARNVMSLERQVRVAAGMLVVLGVIAGATLHPAGYWIAAAIGAGLVYAGLTNQCGMTLVLAKFPWNQGTA